MKWNLSEVRAAWLLVAPVLLLFLAFRIIPAGVALYFSFTEYNIIRPLRFIGFANYSELMSNSLFWVSMRNTLVFTLSTVAGTTIVGLVVALMLNAAFPAVRLLRTIFFLPVAVSMVASAQIWIFMLNPEFGFINYVSSSLGLGRPNWLFEPRLAMLSIVVVTVWKNSGLAVIVYLAGLQSIPAHLYEAAKIDGLGLVQQFLRITLPMLGATTTFLVFLLLVVGFQAFDQIYLLTGGGPVDATTTVVHQIYETAFGYFQIGYASAMAFVLAAVLACFSGGLSFLRGRERWRE